MTVSDGFMSDAQSGGASSEDVSSGSDDTGGALFGGDDGGLSFAQRRCLVTLLKQRYISHRTHPEQWKILLAHRVVLSARLNDLFLTLHVDFEREVAYKRQAVPDDGGDRFPTLLQDTAYNREQTVLLVVLRERLQRERAAGADKVIVDLDDLVDLANEFRSADVTDIVGEDKRVRDAVASLVKARVLEDLGDSRFAVSPVLDSLLPLERLHELLDWLRAANGTSDGGGDDDDDDDDIADPSTAGLARGPHR